MRRLIAISALLLTACATVQDVTYASDPPGALIMQGGGSPMLAPAWLRYTFDPQGPDCITLAPVQAVWASGATVTESARICPHGRMGQNWSYTLRRPADAPGLQTDLAAARDALVAEEMRELRRAANDAALAAALSNAIGAAFVAAAPPRTYRPPASINCTSTQMGNQVVTNC